jgi:hypothetical protein
MDDFTPRPGDLTVCLYCGHLQAFDADLKLRNLTDEEMHAIAGDEKLLAAQRICAEYRRRHP